MENNIWIVYKKNEWFNKKLAERAFNDARKRIHHTDKIYVWRLENNLPENFILCR